MKTCRTCKQPKEITEFYACKLMRDGVFSDCKTCYKAAVNRRERKNRKDPVWLKQERERCRIKQANYRKRGKAAKTKNSTKSAWRKRNRFKAKAHSIAASAVKSGKLKRPENCDGCHKPAKRLEKHHDDYKKPLEVRWLCPPCHGLTKRKG